MKEVVLTNDWPLSRMEPYGPQITAAMKKLIARFPKDLTLESMREDLFKGSQQLWLMLDDGKFEAFALTEIKTVKATGHKSVILTALGGEGGTEMVPFITEIEEWARSIGANDLRPVGRLGWRKALKAQGYDVITAYYRKNLD